MAHPQLKLKTVTRTQGANTALKDGSVSPRQASLEFVEIPVLVHAFRRMVRQLEFDVCEMAATTYLCAKRFGVGFTAIPVFLVRGFHHGAVMTHPTAGVEGPKDLEGRRVGVNRGYTVTTGVWARSILAREHGVALDRVTWVLSGDEHVEQYRPPANVVPVDPGADLVDLLAAGELAAVVGAGIAGPRITPLIHDPTAAAIEAVRRRGFFPFNHLVVVRDDLLAAYPGLAADLFEAFAAAKTRYVTEIEKFDALELSGADRVNRQVMAITGTDPLPYGIEPNRDILEELIDAAVAQHILDRRPTLDDLFAAETRDLVA
ncbi:MAG: ABC transporter substrate-binding protein [Acidimicrobiales bacterium]